MCELTGCQRIALEARFLQYVHRLPSGCMIWTGSRSQGGGGKEKRSRGGPYGTFNVGKDRHGNKIGPKRTHIVWAFLTGKLPSLCVPPGLHVDHECDSGTLCVACTEVVTEAVNLERNWTRGNARHSATRKDQTARLAALAIADEKRRERSTAEKKRRRAAARKRASSNPKKIRQAQNNC